jgi:hypothetical protein
MPCHLILFKSYRNFKKAKDIAHRLDFIGHETYIWDMSKFKEFKKPYDVIIKKEGSYKFVYKK